MPPSPISISDVHPLTCSMTVILSGAKDLYN